MARVSILSFICAFVLVTEGFSQSGAVIPQGGAGHANAASCVILKRMGPADQVTSHLYSFGIRGKQFQYVEGKLPDGFPFHGRLTDHDVRNLQGRGAEVVVVNQDFTAEDLRQARADCKEETGKTPNQAETQPTASLSKPTGNSTPTVAPTAGTTELSVSSSPTGADIEVDGKFVGSTPSSIRLAAGDHSITVKKNGFATWNRNMTTSAGTVTISAELESLQTAKIASIPSSAPSNVPTLPAGSAGSVTATNSPDTSRSPSEQVDTVAVFITSDPNGADIFVDSKGVGSAPKQLQLKTGPHSIVVVKSGYKDCATKLVVERGAAPRINAKLER